ncbi:LuxR family transcriptional regulator [Streptomyces sp. NPDC047130]|uniref:helix-turn-helix transcriptional regulator n=1 Tax=Streptomyces sp. NPDC047130 TaxID=3155261 RepID=UPI0033C6E156
MELIRRGGELGSLERLLTGAGQGRAAAALVTGSPGTGKSALLEAFADRAAAAGATVLSALATPAETDLPHGVVGQLLSGAGLAPAGPPPAGTSAGPPPPGPPSADPPPVAPHGPAALHDALCARAAAARPVVLLVDDVHHADEPSVRCLLYLCGRLPATGALLVLAGQRPAEPSVPLAELLRHPRSTTAVHLEPLPEDAVADFLTSAGAGVVEPAAARRLARPWHGFTGGNPRLLHALLDDHRGCGPVRPARPVAGAAFRQAVRGCLRAAGPATHRAARALALLAGDATLTLLARFLSDSEHNVALALEQLDATGLLDAGRLRHAGVRAAVLQELTARENARLHARAADVLHHHGAPPPAVAAHLLAAAQDAADPAPAWARPVLTEAASHALRTHRPHHAAQFLRAAHPAPGDAPPPAYVRELARAEWETDPAAVLRHLPALEHQLAAPKKGDPAHTVTAAGLLLWHGRAEGAARAAAALGRTPHGQELGAALAGARPGGGPALAVPDVDALTEQVLASALHAHAPAPSVAALLATLLHAGRTGNADRWCAQTTGAEPARTTPARHAVLAAVTAVVHVRTGSHDAAARYAGRALALLGPAAWGAAVGVPLSAAVRAATALGAHEEAARLLRVPVPEHMFASWAGLYYLMARGHHLSATGSHRAALGDFHACRDLLALWNTPPDGAADWRPGAARARRELAADGTDTDPAALLTPAERRVAALAAAGCTNRAIAARLYVTPSTVEQHLTNVYRKLSVTSRADLATLLGAGARPAATAGAS